jgi:hypothetical protein
MLDVAKAGEKNVEREVDWVEWKRGRRASVVWYRVKPGLPVVFLPFREIPSCASEVPSCEGNFGNSASKRCLARVGVFGSSGVVKRVLFEGVALLLREVEEDCRDRGRFEEPAVSKRPPVTGKVSIVKG